MALLGFLGVAYPHQPANAGAFFFELYQQSKLYCTLGFKKKRLFIF